MGQYDVNQSMKSAELLTSIRRLNMTDRLTERKLVLETELARVNKAIDLLNAQPAVQEVLNTLAELNFNF